MTCHVPLCLRSALALALLISAARTASAEDITLRMVDQGGADLSNTFISVDGGPLLATGSTVTISPGSHTFSLSFGTTAYLRRTDTINVLAGTTDLDFQWITQDVLMRVVDQFGAELPETFLRWLNAPVLNAPPLVPTGTTVTLPIVDPTVYPTMFFGYADGYDFAVRLGGNGPSTSLSRTDLNVAVVQGTTTLDFEWITEDVLVRVVDQLGAELPGTSVRWLSAPVLGAPTLIPTGTTLAMPIVDPAVYPTMFFAYADGYDFAVRLGGNGPSTSLSRSDSNISVVQGMTTLDFEWITENVLMRVVDEDGSEVSGSSFSWISAPVLDAPLTIPSGTTVTLPIVDPAVYPTMFFAYADGYDFVTRVVEGNLRRVEPGLDTNRVVLQGVPFLDFEWQTLDCPLQVLDSNGIIVPGSNLVLPNGVPPYVPGARVVLPTTDNGVYPTLFSNYADGYPIQVIPGDVAPASGTFLFEVLGTGDLTPASFTIAGNDYSLAPALQATANPFNATPPYGPNRSILTATPAVIGSTWTATFTHVPRSLPGHWWVTVRKRKSSGRAPTFGGAYLLSGSRLWTAFGFHDGVSGTVSSFVPNDCALIEQSWAAQGWSVGYSGRWAILRTSSGVAGVIGTY